MLDNPQSLIAGWLENYLKFNRRKYGKVLRESWYEKCPKQRYSGITQWDVSLMQPCNAS